MKPGVLTGKTALLTGASRGLGLEIAQSLVRAGASIGLVAQNPEPLEQAAKALCSQGASISTYTADLADTAEVDSMFKLASDDLGGFDILINNAAVQGPIGKTENVDFAAWKRAFAVNVFAPVRLCQLAIPEMHRRGGGKIINISGGGATGPRPNFSAYGASKCALVRLTETLAHELSGSGIDVNAVAPGPMNTRMLEEVLAAGPQAAAPEYEAAMARSRAGGRSPARAAELVVFLASSVCDGITGRLISAIWDDW